jgi:hypothetical protein
MLENVPYLTKQVNDTMIAEDGTIITLETKHEEVVTEEITENAETQVWNEETGLYETVITPITKQVPVLDKHYISKPCSPGFILPKYDWTADDWVEGGSAPTPKTPIPTTEERLAAVEMVLMDLLV